MWAQGPNQQDGQEDAPVSVQPANTVSADDLEVTDCTGEEGAVTIIDSPGTILDPIDLGIVTVEGWSAGDIQVLEKTDLENVQIEYRKAELVAWYYRQIEELEVLFPEP